MESKIHRYSFFPSFLLISKVQYQVNWLGLDDSHNTWLPIDGCDCVDAIKEFESENTEEYTVETVVEKRIKNGQVIPLSIQTRTLYNSLHMQQRNTS